MARTLRRGRPPIVNGLACRLARLDPSRGAGALARARPKSGAGWRPRASPEASKRARRTPRTQRPAPRPPKDITDDYSEPRLPLSPPSPHARSEHLTVPSSAVVVGLSRYVCKRQEGQLDDARRLAESCSCDARESRRGDESGERGDCPTAGTMEAGRLARARIARRNHSCKARGYMPTSRTLFGQA